MSITFDGTNIAEVAAYAGHRVAGLLIRHGDGHLSIAEPGAVLEDTGDDLAVWSSRAWQQRKSGETA